MKRITQNSFTGIEALTITETAPPIKTPFSAIIENKYTPVLPWDWLSEKGQLQSIHPVNLPTTIGFSFAGIVREVGLLRNTNLIGKAVFGANPGGTAGELVNSQIPPLLFEIPTGVDLQQAATIIGGADTAWHAVNDVLHVNQNDHILIIGASGGVGQYLLQLSKLHNATITSVVSESSQQFVVKLGSDEVVVYDNNLENQLNKFNSTDCY
ncbi:quinone oxidoreductase family protein [Paucilactobacillus kaifaensis]|uniref:quinone oxidoreductase family protein n=1 Tax=Paucilactobacillus kaifaensis TaxID=2559921 RepID=UPI0010F78577|nr:zinc-binding alcohol dehydrogenase [Paucilactobacillus kaifaensis]